MRQQNDWHDFINFLSVHFLRKWNLTTVSSVAQMEGVYGAPMFNDASQNTTLAMPLWCWHCISPVMADRIFSLRAVFMLIGQRASQMGRTFSPQWREPREKSGIACSEDYKKMSGWITGWLFSHTAATHLCSNTFCIIGPL